MPRLMGVTAPKAVPVVCLVDPAMSGLDLYQTQRALALLFVYAAVTGFVLGVFYDLLRTLRLLRGESRKETPDAGQGRRSMLGIVLLFFEDVCFMLIVAVALILLCYFANDGRIRMSAIVGIACGFFVYVQTLGRLVICLAEILTGWIRKALAFVWRMILLPLRWLWMLLSFLWRKTVGRAILAHRRKVAESAAQAAQAMEPTEGQGMEAVDTLHTNTHEVKPPV